MSAHPGTTTADRSARSRVTRGRYVVAHGAAGGNVALRRESRDLCDPAEPRASASHGVRIIREYLATGRVLVAVPRPELATYPRGEASSGALTCRQRVTDFVARNLAGLIQFGREVGSADVLAWIIQQFPAARIAVLGGSQAALDSARRRVAAQVPQGRVLAELPNDRGEGFLAFSTFLNAADGDLAGCHVVIVLDAPQVVHRWAYDPLNTADRGFIVFGLLHEDRILSPLERDKIFLAFGPLALDVSALDSVRRCVQVQWLDIFGASVAASSDLQLLRRACWNNPPRNRRIAQAARRWSRGLDPQSVLPPPSPRVVCVVVAAPEHAVALSRLLPDWPVLLHNVSPHLVTPTGRPSRRRPPGPASLASCSHSAIVTLAAAESRNWSATDVVVWAGNGPCPPELPYRLPIAAPEQDRPLILLDCRDQFMPQLADWSRRRRRGYGERGWYDAGESAVGGAIDRFLAADPQRARLLQGRGGR